MTDVVFIASIAAVAAIKTTQPQHTITAYLAFSPDIFIFVPVLTNPKLFQTLPMCNHESRKCPRCGNAFACKLGNITQCQCFGIEMSADQRAYMDQKYEDCLCRDCLVHLQSEVNRFVEMHIKR